MADREKALRALDAVCAALDENNWHYDVDREDITASLTVNGDDIPMRMVFRCDKDFDYVSLICFVLPFSVDEAHAMDVAMAVNALNYSFQVGCFDFSLEKGNLIWRITSFYETLEPANVHKMISYTNYFVDKYNDRFFALAKGLMDVNTFIARIGKD